MMSGGHLPQVLIFSKDDHKEATLLWPGTLFSHLLITAELRKVCKSYNSYLQEVVMLMLLLQPCVPVCQLSEFQVTHFTPQIPAALIPQ